MPARADVQIVRHCAAPTRSMRILAINQFYAPDHAATSQLLTDLCTDLVAAGDEVSVIASRGGYLGGGKLPAREIIDGVEVLRPWATSMGKASIPRRLADYGTFWLSAVARAASVRRPDVILALTTPPLIAAGAVAVAKAREVPLVAWVQDVYPEVAIEFGVLSPHHPAVPVLSGISRATHRMSSRVVALSEGMADRLAAAGAPRDRLSVIPNWADGETLRPIPHDANAFRREHDLLDRFVAMYSGNLGVGHDVATLIDAARRLSTSAPEVVLVFVGDGARRAEAERLSTGLPNVAFLPYQPRERLAESLSAADVHLVSLREGLEGLLVPSKFYGAIACGRPVFFIGPEACDVARTIQAEHLGWVGRPGDGAGLADALGRLARDPSEHARICGDARRVFLARYDRAIATAAWRRVLLEVAQKG